MASKALQNARYGAESMDENVIDVIGEDGTVANSYRQERAYGTCRSLIVSSAIGLYRPECRKLTEGFAITIGECKATLGGARLPQKYTFKNWR